MQELQSDLVPLQFEMSDAAEKLGAALAASRVDEEKAAGLADRLMSLESRIKRRHLALMIRIKNTLTAEQQDRLRGLREESGGRRGEGGRRPRAPGGAGGRSGGSVP
jgi:Spy/CpxP family protein refolding chaperone